MQDQLEHGDDGKEHSALSFPPEKSTKVLYKMPMNAMHLMFSEQADAHWENKCVYGEDLSCWTLLGFR